MLRVEAVALLAERVAGELLRVAEVAVGDEGDVVPGGRVVDRRQRVADASFDSSAYFGSSKLADQELSRVRSVVGSVVSSPSSVVDVAGIVDSDRGSTASAESSDAPDPRTAVADA